MLLRMLPNRRDSWSKRIWLKAPILTLFHCKYTMNPNHKDVASHHRIAPAGKHINRGHIIDIDLVLCSMSNHTTGMLLKVQSADKATLSSSASSHPTTWTGNFISLHCPFHQEGEDAPCPSPPVLCCCFCARCHHSFAVMDWSELHCIQSMRSGACGGV